MKQTRRIFSALVIVAIVATTVATVLRAEGPLTLSGSLFFRLPESAAASLSGTSAPTDKEWLALMRQAAEKGDAGAQAALGTYYLSGQFGLTKDEREGIKWLQKAADAGDAQGQYILGIQYIAGIGGLKADMQETIRLLRAAGDQGFLPAQKALASIYTSNSSNINGAPPNLEQAAYWYAKAAREHGDADAKAKLFILCCNGTTRAANPAELLDWCRASAEAGAAVAQYLLFDACDAGKAGLPKDEAEARKWLAKAVAQNDLNVQLCLFARAAENRPGHPADAVEAVKWLLATAENSDRQGALQPDYFQSIFTSSPGLDQADAVSWLTVEAGKKRPWALFFLGALYAHGLPSLPADQNHAEELFREAAAAGLPAQQELVRMYGLGTVGIPPYYLGFAQ